MKEALFKKIHGIPAILLVVVILLSGVVLAWYSFATIDSGTTVQEPLSATETQEFATSIYPGETAIWTFDIVNSADVSYNIKADLTFSEPGGVSITGFTVGITNETDDLTDDDSAEFIIPASVTLPCSMTIKADKDATPGTVSVSLALSRE